MFAFGKSAIACWMVLALMQKVPAQIPPSSHFVLGDTASILTVTDLFIGADGTIYSTGQRVKDSISLYISAVTPSGTKLFELFRNKRFEEKGLFIRPYDQDHFIVSGHSEDGTGTFNVRLLMATYAGAVVWDTTFGDDGQGTMEMPYDLEIDSRGNIIIGGISQTSEIKYLLLKFSPTGKLLWSRKSVPFENGQFYIRDIILDADDNIYGISNNTFITDTSNGTIYKWDSTGAVVWSRSFNMACYEERGNHLVLCGDTLSAVGTRWFSGNNPVAVTVVSLRTNGDLLSYRTIPLYSSQLGVRDFRVLSNGSLVLLDETYTPPQYRLHTFVLFNSAAVMYHDSLLSPAPAKGTVTGVNKNSFTVVRYGGQLSKVQYTVNGGTVSAAAPQEYAVNGRSIELICDVPPFLAAVSREAGTLFERVFTAVYPSSMLSVRHQNSLPPSAPDLLTAYPNPFNPSTTLVLRVPHGSFVTLSVFDPLGRRIADLFSGELSAGTYSGRWNAEGCAGGVYYARLEMNGIVRIVKLLLLK
jgi:hypothetical protein